MQISTKGRYGLRMMTDLAVYYDQGLVPLKEIAARQEISEKYLEVLVKVLVRNGFLVGVRGKGGGYRLAKSPDECTAADILALTEGSLAPVSCLEQDAPSCHRAAECRTLPLWKGLDDVIQNYLSQFTIADLAKQNQEYDYVI